MPSKCMACGCWFPGEPPPPLICKHCRATHEPGADGLPQMVIPGAERITDRELAERRMSGAMQAQARQKPADHGLFESRAQMNLFG